MKVEIWSDVMCPFCYIGKRKFENALSKFPYKDKIEVIWKSFQLDPTTITNPKLNTIDYLAEKKGWSKHQAQETTDYVTNMARQVGLEFNFDKAVVANSLDAHRLLHLAKKYGKQNEVEEKLFRAYFTDGKNTADHFTLLQIGKELNIEEAEIMDVLNNHAYSDEIQQDIIEGQKNGVRGVPFFLLDGKYVISGAQESEIFLQALMKSHSEFQISHKTKMMNVDDQKICGSDGCDKTM